MTFKELNLIPSLLQAIDDMGFETPSEVQEKAIPILLSEKTDFVALAQTGTGKTAAFGFPMIQHIDVSSKNTQAVILSPTRELCLQITNEIELYSKYIDGLNVVAVYGGASITDQARKLKRGCQVIIATPGRMQDMIKRGLVNISKIDICILDEADEMLNMGFYQDIIQILSHTPKEKNTWLFSATMPKEVSTIAKKFMSKPIEVTVGSRNQGNKNIEHEYYTVAGRDRYQALKRLADYNPEIFSVVFCRTKRDTQSVAEKLIDDGYNAAAIHGDLSQSQRDTVMKGFRNKQIQMLIATDVAARGIDVDNITHVINYQLPDEIETYVHRSGRTGRAGSKGVSMVIVTNSEQRKIKQVEKIIKKQFTAKEIPNGMAICEKQLYHLAEGIKNTEIDENIETYLPNIYELLKDFDKDELIKKFFSVEFGRFYNYYKKAKDLSSSGGDGERRNSDEYRYFMNMGERDGFDWQSLKDFLKDKLHLTSEEIFKVDVMEGFSFFNTKKEYKEQVFTLNNESHNGRSISIEVSKESSRGGGGGRNRGGGKGGYKGGGGGNRNSNGSGKKGGYRGGGNGGHRKNSSGGNREGGFKKKKRY